MQFTGSLDISSDGTISGWVFELDNISHVSLDVFVDDLLIRTLSAKFPRPDIFSAFGVLECGFYLKLSDLVLSLIPRASVCKVRLPNGDFLKTTNNNNFIFIHGGGVDDLAEFKNRIAGGWVVDKWGDLKLPFSVAPENKEKFLKLYVFFNELFIKEFGITLLISYGTLLGYARSKDLLPHDDDVDCSYLSKKSNISDVVDEFYFIIKHLNNLSTSFDFEIFLNETGQFTLYKDGAHLDIFSSWIDSGDQYHIYFGGLGKVSSFEMKVKSDNLLGFNISLVEGYVRILEICYGEDWLIPDVSYQWVINSRLDSVNNNFRSLGRDRFSFYKNNFKN